MTKKFGRYAEIRTHKHVYNISCIKKINLSLLSLNYAPVRNYVSLKKKIVLKRVLFCYSSCLRVL